MLSIVTLTLSFSSTPSDKGCFNYYSGSCYCEGDANDCGVGHSGAMPTFYTGTSKYCSHCPNGQGCWDGAFAGGPEHCTCVTEDKCVKNSPAYVSCSDCGADGNPPLKELPQPANAGCFNYYSGSCYCEGEAKDCGVGHDGAGPGVSMPSWYTGSMGRCDHCPNGQGCWDGYIGNASGNAEHCTCVSEDRCIANSPGFVSCSACGSAMADPALRELPQLPTIAEIATSTPELSDLLAAVGAADPSILALLSNPTATITVFAPTNDAFEAVDAFTRAVTTGEIPDQAVVTKVLQKHVVGSVVPASAALDLVNEAVPTLAGEDITVDGSTGSVTVLPVIVEPKSVPANVIQADIYASNGVVHVIDKVLALTPVPGEFDGGCYTGGVCNGAHGCCDCSITNVADCPSPPYIPGTDVARFLPVGCKSGGICQYP